MSKMTFIICQVKNELFFIQNVLMGLFKFNQQNGKVIKVIMCIYFLYHINLT